MIELSTEDEAEVEAIIESREALNPRATRRLLVAYQARGAALDRIRELVRTSGGSCQGPLILALARIDPGPPGVREEHATATEQRS